LRDAVFHDGATRKLTHAGAQLAIQYLLHGISDLVLIHFKTMAQC
jgi:hypothetical protein